MGLNRERLKKAHKNLESSKLSEGSKIIQKSTIKTLDEFCKTIHGQDLDRSMEEIRIGMKGDPNLPYDFLKDFYKYEKEERNISIRSLNMRLSFIKHHFLENGIEVVDSMFKKIHEKQEKHERIGVSAEQIQQVMNFCSNHIKAMMMIQASSGMRISEVLSLRRKDFVKLDRWMIKLKAENTKTKTGRTTFISKEAEEFVLPYLKRLEEDSEERVFPVTRSCMTTALQRAVKASGVNGKYEHSKHNVFTSHALRAFFITQMGKDENNFGHSLAGHDFYMSEYNRLSDQEKLEKYIELEDNLLIFKEIENSKDERISNLERELAEMKKFFKGKKLRLDDFEEE